MSFASSPQLTLNLTNERVTISYKRTSIFSIRWCASMLLGIRLWVLLSVYLSPTLLLAQCPGLTASGGFGADSICFADSVQVVNSSIGANTYIWDFCADEDPAAPIAGPVYNTFSGTASGGNARNLAVVQSASGQWHIFVGRQGGLLRLDYGNSLENTPTTVDLGNPGGLIGTTYSSLSLIEDGSGFWYLFLIDFTSRAVVRYDLNTLTNPAPTATTVFLAPNTQPTELSIIEDHTGSYYGFIGYLGSSQITRLDFGSNPSATPSSTNFPTPNGRISNLSIVRTCNRYYGLGVRAGSGGGQEVDLYDFGNSLTNIPTAQLLYSTPNGLLRARWLVHNHWKYAYISPFNNTTAHIINFGDTIDTNISATPISGSDIESLTPVIDSSRVYLFGINRTNGDLTRYYFPSSCSATPSWSTSTSPKVSFQQLGNTHLTLTAIDTVGNRSVIRDSALLLPKPTADFIFDCAPSTINFLDASTPSAAIASWQWDFGDGTGTSNTQNPTYTYTGGGPFDVQLIVNDTNSCTDTTTKPLALVTPPNAIISTVLSCANDSINLIDNTTAGTNPIATRTWQIANDVLVDPGLNFKYWSDTAGRIPIELVVEDAAGCTSTDVDTFTVRKLNLSIEEACANGGYNLLAQYDYPQDPILNAELSLGNGQVISNLQPGTYFASYDSSATYSPELIVNSTAGCEDTIRVDRFLSLLDIQQVDTVLPCQTDTISLVATDSFPTYSWELYPEDLRFSPTQLYQNAGAASAFSGGTQFNQITLIDSADQTVAFLTNDTRIVRADFGSDPTLPPSYTQLTDPVLPSGLAPFRVVRAEDAGQWVGFTVNRSNLIYRVLFDSLRDPSPVVQTISIAGLGLSDTRSILNYESPSGQKQLLVGAFSGTAQMIRVNLGTSWLSASHTIDTVFTNNRYAPSTTLVLSCDSVRMLCLTNDNRTLYHLSFGDSLKQNADVDAVLGQFANATTHLVTYTDFGQRYLAGSYDEDLAIMAFDAGWQAPPTVTHTHTGPGWGGVAFRWHEGRVLSYSQHWDTGELYLHSFEAPASVSPSWQATQNFSFELNDTDTVYLDARSQSGRRLHVREVYTPRITPEPVVSIQATSPLCETDSLTLSVQDTNSALTGTSFAWVVDTFNLTGDTVGAVLPFNLNTPVNLTATATNGCTATIDTTLEVRETPQAGFEISSAPCATGAVTFEDTSVYTSGSISVSTWDMGLNEQTLVNPGLDFDYEFINPGAKVVTLSVLGDNGCADTTTQTLPLPSADFSLSQSCAGVSTDVLPDLNYPGDNLTGYDWTLPGGVNSTQPTPPSFTPPEGQATAQLILNTQNGCTDTILRSFSFAQPPEVQIGLPEALCANALLTFVDSSTTNAPTMARQWTFNPAGDVFNPAGSSQSYSFDTSGNFDVQLAVTLEGGCSDSTTRSFSISPEPVVVLPDTFLGCSRQALPLQLDSLANGGANPDYLWSYTTDSGTFFSALSTPAFMVDSTLERRVQLELTNDAGCSATDSTLLIFRPAPRLSLSAAPTTGNVPIAVQFTPTASAFDTLLWRFTGTDTLLTSQDTTQRFTITQAGPQVVELVAFNPSGCTDTARTTLNFAPEIVGIWDVILLELIPDFNTDDGQLHVSALVENNSNLPLEQLTYALRVGEVSVTDSFNFAPIAPGGFTTLELPPVLGVNPYVQPAGICLTLSAPNGFADIDTTNNRRCITLGEGLRVDAVYPSPFRESLTFRAYTEGEVLDVTLFDVLGQRVGEWQFNSSTGTHEHTLDLPDMAEGVYYLRLRAGGQEAVRAVVKR